jgi:hypothetical protein
LNTERDTVHTELGMVMDTAHMAMGTVANTVYKVVVVDKVLYKV